MAKGTINGMPARYNSTLPTLTSGDGTALQTDSRGRLIIAATVLTGSEIEITNDSGNPIPVSGTVTATLPANASVNVAQMNGVTTSMGNGATDTGTQRVTLSNDSTGHVELWDGTTTASVITPTAGATAQAGQNGVLFAPTGVSTATLTLNLASPNTAWYDLLNYPWVSVEILTNSSAATLTFQTSGDASQTNIRSTLLNDSTNSTGGTSSTSTSAVATLSGARSGRYFRVSSNVSGANTVTLVLTFYTSVAFPATMGSLASQSGTWTVQPGNTANTTPWLVNGEGQKATYSASVASLAAVTGDVFTLTGSGSKTIRVTRIQISGAATAATDLDLVVLKRSTADTSGTSTTPTAVPHDSGDAAATATVNAYTAAPTAGTLVGNMFVRKVTVPSLTTPAISAPPTVFDFETRGERAVVLRGTTQVLAFNLPSAPAGASFSIDVTWTEE